MENRVNIKELFIGLQESMEMELNIHRRHIPHQGKKGDATETNWIAWLNQYLPARYEVGSAFVIDHEGSCSEQIDLVIYDRQYTPFIFNKDGIQYIPAESVYAVFDVKQALNKGNIEATAQKINSVRSLKRTTAAIYDARGEIREPKQPCQIMGGIVCTSSDWSPALGDSFESIMKDLDDDHFINVGCVISDGAFLVKKVDGQCLFSRSTKDETLLFFFLNLVMELQRQGTVCAMDINQYAHVLESM